MDRSRRAVSVGVASVLLVACGGGSGPAAPAGGGGSPTPDTTILTKVAVDQTSSAAATYLVKGGQYKVSWNSTGCTNLDIEVKQQDGSFVYSKKTTHASFLAIIPALPDGTYSVTQADPTCATWNILLESTA